MHAQPHFTPEAPKDRTDRGDKKSRPSNRSRRERDGFRRPAYFFCGFASSSCRYTSMSAFRA
jgi:hypothetical protein